MSYKNINAIIAGEKFSYSEFNDNEVIANKAKESGVEIKIEDLSGKIFNTIPAETVKQSNIEDLSTLVVIGFNFVHTAEKYLH